MLIAAALTGCATSERAAPVAEPAVVPSLSGVPVADAVDALQAAGLRVELETVAATPAPLPLDACATGAVARQDTAPGSELVRGSTVVLSVTGCTPVTSPAPTPTP